MNLIKRKIAITKIPRTFSDVKVFYVTWTREDQMYYICDATEDYQNILWSIHSHHAVEFSSEAEATQILNDVLKTRSRGNIQVTPKTLKVHDPASDNWII